MPNKSLIAALAATTMLAGGFAYAADQPMAHGQMQGGQMAMPPGHAAVVKDFGKLSADGARGYQDVKLARLAIFDGDIGDAKKIAARAEQEFGKAKTDETVFTKAEAEMRSRTVAKADDGKAADSEKPAAANAQGGAGANVADADAAKPGTASTGSASDVTKPIAWLPVDGVIGLAEDYSAQPAKAQAVAKANDSLAKGDKKGAMDTLKLAGVDLDVVTAVVPLQQTLSDVHDAAQLINDGKYYEGSQKLRMIENSAILISDNMEAVPNAGGKADASKADASKAGASNSGGK